MREEVLIASLIIIAAFIVAYMAYTWAVTSWTPGLAPSSFPASIYITSYCSSHIVHTTWGYYTVVDSYDTRLDTICLGGGGGTVNAIRPVSGNKPGAIIWIPPLGFSRPGCKRVSTSWGAPYGTHLTGVMPGAVLSARGGLHVVEEGEYYMFPEKRGHPETVRVCPYGPSIYNATIVGDSVVASITEPGCAPFLHAVFRYPPDKIIVLFNFTPTSFGYVDKDVNFYVDVGQYSLGYYANGFVKQWELRSTTTNKTIPINVRERAGMLVLEPRRMWVFIGDNTTVVPLNATPTSIRVGLARLAEAPFPPIKIQWFIRSPGIIADQYVEYPIYDVCNVTLDYSAMVVNVTCRDGHTVDIFGLTDGLYPLYVISYEKYVSRPFDLINVPEVCSNCFPNAVAIVKDGSFSGEFQVIIGGERYDVALPPVENATEDVLIIFHHETAAGTDLLLAFRVTMKGRNVARFAPLIVEGAEQDTVRIYVGETFVFEKPVLVLKIVGGESGNTLSELHLSIVPVVTTAEYFDDGTVRVRRVFGRDYMVLAYGVNPDGSVTVIAFASHGYASRANRTVKINGRTYYLPKCIGTLGCGNGDTRIYIINATGHVIAKIYVGCDTRACYIGNQTVDVMVAGYYIMLPSGILILPDPLYFYGGKYGIYVYDPENSALYGPYYIGECNDNGCGYGFKATRDGRVIVIGARHSDGNTYVIRYTCGNLTRDNVTNSACWATYVIPKPDDENSACIFGRRVEVTDDGEYVLITGPNCKYLHIYKWGGAGYTEVARVQVRYPGDKDEWCYGRAITVSDNHKIGYILVSQAGGSGRIVVAKYNTTNDTVETVFTTRVPGLYAYNPFYGWYVYKHLRALVVSSHSGAGGIGVVYDVKGRTAYIIRSDPWRANHGSTVDPLGRWAVINAFIFRFQDYNVPRDFNVVYKPARIGSEIHLLFIGSPYITVEDVYPGDIIVISVPGGRSASVTASASTVKIDLTELFSWREILEAVERGGFEVSVVPGPAHPIFPGNALVHVKTGGADVWVPASVYIEKTCALSYLVKLSVAGNITLVGGNGTYRVYVAGAPVGYVVNPTIEVYDNATIVLVSGKEEKQIIVPAHQSIKLLVGRGSVIENGVYVWRAPERITVTGTGTVVIHAKV